LSNSITTINTNAFRDCITLRNIEIPNSVTSIKACAFSGCSSLQDIDIPNGIKDIKANAFANCIALRKIKVHNKEVDKIMIDDTCFKNVDFENCVLQIPIGTRWAYRHHPIFSKFKNITTESFE